MTSLEASQVAGGDGTDPGFLGSQGYTMVSTNGDGGQVWARTTADGTETITISCDSAGVWSAENYSNDTSSTTTTAEQPNCDPTTISGPGKELQLAEMAEECGP